MIYFVIAIIVLILLYIIIQYNTFIKLTNSVKEAFATMDVYLKKRWDLIPNIVSIVKGYAKHESNTLEEVVKIRSLAYEKMSVTDKIDTNEQLQNYLDRLIINIENYPELKADKNF